MRVFLGIVFFLGVKYLVWTSSYYYYYVMLGQSINKLSFSVVGKHDMISSLLDSN